MFRNTEIPHNDCIPAQQRIIRITLTPPKAKLLITFSPQIYQLIKYPDILAALYTSKPPCYPEYPPQI